MDREERGEEEREGEKKLTRGEMHEQSKREKHGSKRKGFKVKVEISRTEK